jgi:hypothetical protein
LVNPSEKGQRDLQRGPTVHLKAAIVLRIPANSTL